MSTAGVSYECGDPVTAIYGNPNFLFQKDDQTLRCSCQYPVPPHIDDLSPEYGDSLLLRLRDGRELRAEQAIVPGSPDAPLNEETLLKKAFDCFATGGVPEESRQDLCDALLHGPERRSVELLISATSPS